MPGGLLVCGNAVYDILVRPVDRIAWGTSHWIELIEPHMGGNGANTALAAARLGSAVRLVSAVGRDRYGEEIIERLRAHGVDLSAVERAEAGTPATAVLVNSEGERALLHRPGVASTFGESVELTDVVLDAMCHFHLANPFALPKIRARGHRLLQRAKEAGLGTSVDTGWDAQNRWMEDFAPCLPYTDLVFANEEELRMLTGAPGAECGTRRLLQEGAKTVIVKLGARGAELFTRDSAVHVAGFRVPVVDTTGAGDCFAGAFLAAVLRGAALPECARIANAAGALAIQHLGSTEGLRGWEETLAWAEKAPRA